MCNNYTMQAQTYERINVLIPIKTAEELRKVIPRGQRSRIITEAIDEKLSKLSRKDMYKELLRIRKGMPQVSMEEVVEWVREDRVSH